MGALGIGGGVVPALKMITDRRSQKVAHCARRPRAELVWCVVVHWTPHKQPPRLDCESVEEHVTRACGVMWSLRLRVEAQQTNKQFDVDIECRMVIASDRVNWSCLNCRLSPPPPSHRWGKMKSSPGKEACLAGHLDGGGAHGRRGSPRHPLAYDFRNTSDHRPPRAVLLWRSRG